MMVMSNNIVKINQLHATLPRLPRKYIDPTHKSHHESSTLLVQGANISNISFYLYRAA